MIEKMLKYIMAELLFIILPIQSTAQDKNLVKTISVAFDANDFSLSYNSARTLVISTNKLKTSYGDDINEPCLPFIPLNVLIPDNNSYLGFNMNSVKTLIKENVIIAANSIQLPTNQCMNEPPIVKVPQYGNKTYPSSIASYVGTSVMDGYTILNFQICPFEYDAQEKKLFFHEEMTLSIDLEKSFNRTATFPKGKGNNMREIVRSLVINPDEIETIQESRSTATSDTIEKYVVITSSNLASAFQPLVQWKKTKGYDTEIITLEDINANYAGTTTQIKIKTCLYDQYLNHNLKYALLGGDDTIVPVQGCYSKSITFNDVLLKLEPTLKS